MSRSSQDSEKKASPQGFATRAIHAGQQPAPGCGAIMTPVYQTSTYVQSSPGTFDGPYDYARSANPTRTALEENLAALEGGTVGLCFSSGCAAVDAILHTLTSGDHVLCSDDVYGGTYRLFENVFRKAGITFSFVDLTDLSRIETEFTDRTKLVWLETPSNPLLKVIDISALAEAAHAHEAALVVDNTFASPALQNPLALGADLVLHSSTKYIGGHSDVIGGAIITSDEAWAQQLRYIQNAVGAVPSPWDCFLLLRSTKTLAVRMEAHIQNAKEVTAYLKAHPKIERIIYPTDESHPQSALAQRQMRGGGGIVTAVLKGGLTQATRFLERVQLFALAESLGGVESLVEHPAIMTHASIPAEIRESLGISDGLVRLSVGIESSIDLLADLEQALNGSSLR